MPNIRIPPKRCKTCVFSSATPVPIEVLRARWVVGNSYQVCHQYQVQGDERYDEDGFDLDVMCRGYFDSEISESAKQFLTSIPGFVEIVATLPREGARRRAPSDDD